ncbi:MAG: CoA ester lyase [Caldilineaceae bacterium]
MESSTQPALRTRRSLLFMPGDSMRKIEKAAQLPVDSIVMDLEDGVAHNRKATGRQTIVEALQTLDFGHRERLIRINPVGDHPMGGQLWDVDLEATVQAQPDGYVLPKVEYANDLLTVDQYLTEVERRNNWPLLSIRLLALVETARGVMNLREIAAASSRLDALAIGAEDLAGDMGATRTSMGWEVFYARSALVTAAAAFGLQAIDTVFVDLNDLDGLRAEAAQVQKMGFMGKLAIHPRQVAVINDVFTPSAAEIAQARRIIHSFEEHQAAGDGAFELDGKMVDAPMMKAARRVLARADVEPSS